MPFNPQSGLTGSVKVGDVSYAFGKWKVSYKQNLPKVNNFTSAYQQLVNGLTSATVTITGPYDAGNMDFTVGDAVEFVLAVNAELSFTVPVLLSDIEIEDDIDDAARVTLTGQSTGDFEAAI